MTLKITETDSYVTVVVPAGTGSTQTVLLDHTEQHELLEALARVLGFSLVDHVERRSLTELVLEVRHPEQTPEPNVHLVRSQCSWRKTAEALATAVADTLDIPEA